MSSRAVLLYHGSMNLGFSEMIFIFLLALIIFGPKKLPEIGRQIGKAMAEFKRASNQFKAQLEDEMRQIEITEALKKEKDSLNQVLNDPTKAIANALMPPEGSVASGSIVPPPTAQPPDGEVKAEPAAAPVADPGNSSDYSHLYPPVESPVSPTADVPVNGKAAVTPAESHPASPDPGKGANA